MDLKKKNLEGQHGSCRSLFIYTKNIMSHLCTFQKKKWVFEKGPVKTFIQRIYIGKRLISRICTFQKQKQMDWRKGGQKGAC